MINGFSGAPLKESRSDDANAFAEKMQRLHEQVKE
jgi:hypothetical protein